MSRGSRFLLIFLLTGFTVVVLGVGGVAAAVSLSPKIAVQVQDDSSDVQVSVPSFLVHLAVLAVPSSVLRDATRDAEPYLPAVSAAWAELERTPDFRLVEVVGPDGVVWVEKRSGRLVIHVDERDAQVDVAIPLRTVGVLLSKLDS